MNAEAALLHLPRSGMVMMVVIAVHSAFAIDALDPTLIHVHVTQDLFLRARVSRWLIQITSSYRIPVSAASRILFLSHVLAIRAV